MSRIYKVTETAVKNRMDWDEAIAAGEIETVKEFDNIEEAIAEYENGGYDPDIYGVE
jgi:hypothetical protein